MFLDNKYTRWYLNIVTKRKTFLYDGYTEKHHIIPKSLGGSNEPENLVRLSAKEHFICHLLLTKMTEGKAKEKMVNAAFTMRQYRNKPCEIKIGSRTYQLLREQFAKMISIAKTGVPRSPETRAKIAETKRGTKMSVESRAKMSAAHRGIPSKLKGTTRSEEVRAKISASSKGRTQSTEHITKRVAAHVGAKRSEETKQNLSNAMKGKGKGVDKPRIVCPHCGKEGGIPVMKRYHFDKCSKRSNTSQEEACHQSQI